MLGLSMCGGSVKFVPCQRRGGRVLSLVKRCERIGEEFGSTFGEEENEPCHQRRKMRVGGRRLEFGREEVMNAGRWAQGIDRVHNHKMYASSQ